MSWGWLWLDANHAEGPLWKMMPITLGMMSHDVSRLHHNRSVRKPSQQTEVSCIEAFHFVLSVIFQFYTFDVRGWCISFSQWEGVSLNQWQQKFNCVGWELILAGLDCWDNALAVHSGICCLFISVRRYIGGQVVIDIRYYLADKTVAQARFGPRAFDMCATVSLVYLLTRATWECLQ